MRSLFFIDCGSLSENLLMKIISTVIIFFFKLYFLNRISLFQYFLISIFVKILSIDIL